MTSKRLEDILTMFASIVASNLMRFANMHPFVTIQLDITSLSISRPLVIVDTFLAGISWWPQVV